MSEERWASAALRRHRNGDAGSGSATKPTVRKVYETLRRWVIAGELVPGQRLPAAELATRLNVSRSPVREAFIMLESDGFIIGEYNKGYRVRPLSRKIVVQLYAVRAELEAFGIRHAAENLDAIGAAERQQVLDAMDDLDRLRESPQPYPVGIVGQLVQANRCVHETLISASGNPQLVRLVSRTVDRGIMDRAYDFLTADDLKEANDFHRMIVSRLFRGDGDRAASLMREHVLISRDLILNQIDRLGGDVTAVYRRSDETRV